jgi:hypothetical protein
LQFIIYDAVFYAALLEPVIQARFGARDTVSACGNVCKVITFQIMQITAFLLLWAFHTYPARIAAWLFKNQKEESKDHETSDAN